MKYTVQEAAYLLGITTSGVRQRIKSGTLKGKQGSDRRWTVYLNGDESDADVTMEDVVDPITEIADELIALGKRLKKVVKEHDEYIRNETIVNLGETLAASVKG